MEVDCGALGAGLKRGQAAAGSEEIQQRESKTVKKEKDNGKGASTAKGSSKSGGGKKFSKDDKQFIQLVMNIAKLTVSTAREVSMLKAVVLTVTLFDREEAGGEFCARMKKVGEDYNNMTKTMTNHAKQELGSPHVFAWLEAVKFLQEKHNGSGGEAAVLQAIKAYQLMVQDKIQLRIKDHKDFEQLAGDEKIRYNQIYLREETARHCKCYRNVKCWNPKQSRLEFHMQDPEPSAVANYLVKWLVKEAGGIRKHSQAPRGDLERKIVRAMQEAKELEEE
eukprot:TRINITY_DN17239_c0_g1_i1.p2 TRINITY_DN17239_c0_g1~~TRINITY_DN17239_c0_g1_i1.p2  ORF type:complete len:279 (-),score=120.03 TRINITY_DN17239_c0_g1_i1:389-1225(-)